MSNSVEPMHAGYMDTPDGLIFRPRNRLFYLLPNAFTSANLFFGLDAILQAILGNFMSAAAAIYIAMLFDSLDGRVARLTHTQSEFGMQYDSLSDMVSFGIAPATLIYLCALQHLGKLGWIAAFIYALGAALRLARFNVQATKTDKTFFTGLPSPAAASLIASLVLLINETGDYRLLGDWSAWGIAAFAGITMVTSMKFYSFKNIRFLLGSFMVSAILAALLIAWTVHSLAAALFVLFLSYAVSGYLRWLILKMKHIASPTRDDGERREMKPNQSPEKSI